jgi:small subunit ribosomal protein S1
MTTESSQNREPDQNQDNEFWSSLFAQEEFNAPNEQFANPDLTSLITDSVANGRYHPDTPSPPTNPWTLAQEAYEAETKLQLPVTGFNKGGLLVQWNGLPGFVPASQLTNFPQFHVPAQRAQVLEESVGQILTLKIIEVNPKANRLILSERAAEVQAEQRQLILGQIRPGDQLTGQVTNLTDFGAFVDLGGVEGLIHISELSWSRVQHPSKVVRPNQQVTVQVIGVDPENERVALSLKRLNPDPWQTAEIRYRPGQIVEGQVSSIVNYGAFIMLEPELEGLVHISELAEGAFLHPRNVVNEGDRVKARVLQVDGKAKRLALSMRLDS